MRSLTIVAYGFALVVMQASLAVLVPMQSYAPNVLLPIVLVLGVSAEVQVVRGAIISFVLGYLLDGLSGNPIGLHTFALVSAFFMARAVGARLALQGVVPQVLASMTLALVIGGMLLAVRAIFERQPPFPTDAVQRQAVSLLWSAVTTALTAPVSFSVVRRIETWFGQRPDERMAAG